MRISEWSSDVCSSDLLKSGLGPNSNRWSSPQAKLWRRYSATEAPSINASISARRPCRGARSEERRVGKECVRTCRSRWSPYQEKKNTYISTTGQSEENTHENHVNVRANYNTTR